ncbi:CBS domain-containing protein [Microlunatus sagamiharensis]|uniref:CBS domain-containing protein n=1 Tax=Microlunatus sagamiharensis TaxID=546874 RepID=A0A1H2LS60_9ACTN|nr:CBS domain-containing protein [Microlunatus sagamiharensis]
MTAALAGPGSRYRGRVRAGEIAEEYPVVGVDVPALEAVRLLSERRLPGLVVTEVDGRPKAVLPASQIVRYIVPDYVQRDPSLAGVLGEKAADKIAQRLVSATVGDLLPDRPQELPLLQADDTVLELAAVMARLKSPLCAVLDHGRIVGVVTAAHLLELVCGPLT